MSYNIYQHLDPYETEYVVNPPYIVKFFFKGELQFTKGFVWMPEIDVADYINYYFFALDGAFAFDPDDMKECVAEFIAVKQNQVFHYEYREKTLRFVAYENIRD